MSSLASLIVRNVTNTPQLVKFPSGAAKVTLSYVDSGTAGNVRVCCEYASALDAQHRLTQTGAHIVVVSRQLLPGLAISNLPGVYVMTDNAIGGGSNALSLFFEVE